ncbi:hypothetical protein AVDCRST_MAG84-6245 [uncultured Microcoleus sp.]|uniref:Uncharacterized protein n=1 Tax=uncultured Microcoleus sp. TaxID=259945 RepID=A0A6J4P7J9_9CYAN|nr:hypothetical protein AVDCRST_MAG84-6245 [uncultured Microcoleus sp.]
MDCRVALKLPGFCLWTETHRSDINSGCTGIIVDCWLLKEGSKN